MALGVKWAFEIPIRQTTPRSEAIITIKPKAKSVLEINGGAAAKLGLKIGDRVMHRMFD